MSDETFELLTKVMADYDCDSTADAVHTSATIAMEHDEAELARQLADFLQEWPLNYGKIGYSYRK